MVGPKKGYRKFDGKTYTLGWFWGILPRSMVTPDARAKRLRELGVNARVVKGKGWSAIYVRMPRQNNARRRPKTYNHTDKPNQRILVGCETSGVVRDAFLQAGHDVWSCDIEPADSPSLRHIQEDVLKVLDDQHWDIAILHPPCTYLCSSGLHWNTRPGYEDRQQKTEMALDFVRELLDADVDQICLENPVGCISTQIRKPDQYIQPYEFGEDASKKTGLWLKDLPLLQPTSQVEPRMVGGLPRWGNQADSGQGKLWPSADRSKIRAKTYPGIASAMAGQWAVPEGYVDYGTPQPYGFGNYGPRKGLDIEAPKEPPLADAAAARAARQRAARLGLTVRRR